MGLGTVMVELGKFATDPGDVVVVFRGGREALRLDVLPGVEVELVARLPRLEPALDPPPPAESLPSPPPDGDRPRTAVERLGDPEPASTGAKGG